MSAVAVLTRRHCTKCFASYSHEFSACPRDGTILVDRIDPLLDTILDDKYVITQFLGEGGLGVVYQASHVRLGRNYAVKFPRGANVDHPKSRARFAIEARAAGRLEHPNIAAVVDFGETERGLPYLVMEYAHGRSLAELIADQPMSLDRVLDYALQIARGLAHAHAHGVIHRDLKPENVMVSEDHLKIVDFGIALLSELGDEGRLTTKGLVVGTPWYMSPEQLQGTPIDERSDQFSLGMIICEMILGRRVFTGSAVEAAHHIVQGEVPLLRELVPWMMLPTGFEEIVNRLLARVPSARFPAIGNAVDALTAIVRQTRLADLTATPSIVPLSPPRPMPLASVTAKTELAFSPPRRSLWTRMLAWIIGHSPNPPDV
ncbi:MAG: serine/threonine-protein kinase [Kofleriaceae bacterium]